MSDTARMAIDDPTAIPETTERVTEYMQEADRLWNDSRTEDAHTIYRSVFNCPLANRRESSLSGYRLALYLQTIGDIDGALGFVAYTDEPGTHDLEIALRAAMPDQPVDPSEIPQTMEACERYAQSIVNAMAQSDWTTVDALTLAYQQTSVDLGVGRHAINQTYRGVALMHLGNNDEARAALEYAIANSVDADRLAQAHAALQQIGIQVDDGGNPYETPDSQALLAGIAAFEGGDEAGAATQLQTVVDSSDAGASDKGRAHFYLGSMAYHAHRFDEARTHLHVAETDAPDPEKSWAVDMLSWRWQEESP
jgi:tetratricopeptide (TPR) repeat protein